MYWRICIALTTVLALGAAQLAGQTTQPALEPWEQTVTKFTKLSIDESEEAAALAALLSESTSIRKFNSTEPRSVANYRMKTAGLVVLSSHVYAWPGADTIASNLGNDIRSIDNLPEDLNRLFVPRDEATAKRANAVATQWIQSVLRPTAGQVIAVILLSEPAPSLTAALLSKQSISNEGKSPTFVLVKGRKLDDGDFQIIQITYGDSRQALN